MVEETLCVYESASNLGSFGKHMKGISERAKIWKGKNPNKKIHQTNPSRQSPPTLRVDEDLKVAVRFLGCAEGVLQTKFS